MKYGVKSAYHTQGKLCTNEPNYIKKYGVHICLFTFKSWQRQSESIPLDPLVPIEQSHLLIFFTCSLSMHFNCTIVYVQYVLFLLLAIRHIF
jgi:hypothetical protein